MMLELTPEQKRRRALAWLLVRDRPPTAGVAAHEQPRFDRTAILTGLLRVLKNPSTWPTVVVNAGLSGSFFAVGCLAVGTLSDRLKRRKPVVIASSLVYSAVWLVWLSGVALLQPAVGWIMDQRWSGAMANGVRLYTPEDYRWGLLLTASATWLGAVAAWRLRETHCHNIWKDVEKERA